MKYNLDVDALLMGLSFRTSDKTCWNTHCLQIQAGRVWTTDGHILVGHKLAQGPDSGNISEAKFLLSVTKENIKGFTPLLKALAAIGKKTGSKMFASFNTETNTITGLGGVSMVLDAPTSGDFPDVLQIMPRPDALKPVAVMHIDGAYLAKLAKFSNNGSLSLYSTDERSPIVITPPYDKWIAILMPMNLTDTGYERLTTVCDELKASVAVAKAA